MYKWQLEFLLDNQSCGSIGGYTATGKLTNETYANASPVDAKAPLATPLKFTSNLQIQQSGNFVPLPDCLYFSLVSDATTSIQAQYEVQPIKVNVRCDTVRLAITNIDNTVANPTIILYLGVWSKQGYDVSAE